MALGLGLFVLMVLLVVYPGWGFGPDHAIRTLIAPIRTPELTQWVIRFTALGAVPSMSIFSLFVLLYLFFRHRLQDLAYYLFSLLGASLLFVAVKMLVQRPRPSFDIVEVGGYSFPSGHATMAAALAVTLYLIFSKEFTSGIGRAGWFILCLFWALCIAASRVYLDVHWLSDVLAGLGLGLFWGLLGARLFHRTAI